MPSTESWLTKNVRPLCLLALTLAGIADGIVPGLTISDRVWDIIQVMGGGYVLGRSAEKVVREYSKKKESGLT